MPWIFFVHKKSIKHRKNKNKKSKKKRKKENEKAKINNNKKHLLKNITFHNIYLIQSKFYSYNNKY